MKQRVKLRLLLGVLLTGSVTIFVACRPISEDGSNFQATESAMESTRFPGIAQQATAVSNSTPKPTAVSALDAPPEPTAVPTRNFADFWVQIGHEATGLQMDVPPDWVNLSGELDTLAAANQLGLTALLAVDSNRTGSALLASKDIGAGAYAAGLISNFDYPTTDPAAVLLALGNDFEVTPLGNVMDITAVSSTLGIISGAYADYQGGPFIFGGNQSQEIRTRLYLFVADANSRQFTPPSQALFLFSAAADQWQTHLPIFEQIAETFMVHDIFSELLINDGSSNMLGSLGELDSVNGRLEPSITDIWTFNGGSGRYATITVSPNNNEALDLTLSIIGPSGQTITQLDNGFAGDTVLVSDLFLTTQGVYLIEVSDFFNESGQYTLSLVITDAPLFNDNGRIEIGQTIQSNIPSSGEKIWTFDGIAGELISIVLMPEDPFDAILNFYSPDGTRLVGLDEGFSGDSELLSGYELPVTGEYTIQVRSFTGDGGRYSLSLNRGGEDTINFYDAGDLTYGVTKRETLQESEAHAWFFDGKAGDEINILVTPLTAALDLDIWLLDSDIERLTTQDAFSAGESENISYILPADGQYLILVSEFFGTVGEYEIQLSASQIDIPVDAGSIAYGDPVAGTLSTDQTVVWYFNGQAGDLIDIELTTTDAEGDFILFVQSPDGNQIRTVDILGSGAGESLFMLDITEDGQWGIVIKEFFGDVIPYTLTISRSE